MNTRGHAWSGGIGAGPGRLLLVIALSGMSLPEDGLATTPGRGGFLENIGQLDERVRFSTSAPGMTVFFTPDELVIDAHDPAPGEGTERLPEDLSGDLEASLRITTSVRSGHVIRVRFQDASPAPRVTGRTALPGAFNFFKGADPASWHTGARRYAEITYREIWPGIDLVFRLTPLGLEYDVLVGSGADPSQVRFAYEGADHVQESDGTARIETSVGDLIHRSAIAGDTSGSIRREDAGDGSPLGGHCDAFFDWITLLGGTGDDIGSAIALDASGQPVVTGQTTSTDFPTTPGAYAGSSEGDWDSFVTKLDDTGSDLVWSTYIGGELLDWATALTLDALDDVVIAGLTRSADYPTTPGAYDTTASLPVDDLDTFVTKLSSGGDSILWSTYLGGDADEAARGAGVVMDAAGNVLVCGDTVSGDFPTTAGAHKRVHPDGDRDAYVTKVAADGASLVWSTLLGGDEAAEFIKEIDLDAAGNPVVGGLTRSVEFPTTLGVYGSTYSGVGDGFITKLEADGSDLEWSTFVGGSTTDQVEAIVIDPSTGHVIAAIRTYGGDFPTTPGAFDEDHNGMIDVAVLQMSADGSALDWSTFLGGWSDDWVGGLAIGPEGHLFVIGATASWNFPTTGYAFDGTYNGAYDGFISIVQNDGTDLVWSTFMGGGSPEDPCFSWGCPDYWDCALNCDGDPVCLPELCESPGYPYHCPDGFDCVEVAGGFSICQRSCETQPDAYEGFTDDFGKPVVVRGDAVYMVGLTGSNDFPTCPSGGIWDATLEGARDAVVLRMAYSSTIGVPELVVTSHPRLTASPNPFRGVATISYELPAAGTVRVTVHDVVGRLVRMLEVPERLPAGTHRLTWDGLNGSGSPVVPGVYFVRLEAGDGRRAVRLVRIE